MLLLQLHVSVRDPFHQPRILAGLTDNSSRSSACCPDFDRQGLRELQEGLRRCHDDQPCSARTARCHALLCGLSSRVIAKSYLSDVTGLCTYWRMPSESNTSFC